MTPQDLRAAAARIEMAAGKCRVRADAALDANLAALHGAVAQQLDHRAAQVRSWADQAEHIGEVTADMEAATREFLKYAGCK